MTLKLSALAKENSTYSQLGFLVRIYPSLARNEELEKELAVAFSTPSCVWLGSFDLNSSYLKTLEIFSRTKKGERSKKFSFKLPKQGTMLNGQLFQLEMWEPAINANVSGSLPTPNTMDSLPLRSKESMIKQVTKTRPGRTQLSNLREAVNPEAVQLFEELKKMRNPPLPTPTARDHKDSGPNLNYEKAHQKRRLAGSAVVLTNSLPTPCARDWKGRSGQGFQDRSGGRPRQLPDVLTRSGESTYLNPHFVEEMMGYPIGYLV
jgi:hypothetical protein